jgi:hypothetical protein
MQLVGSSVTAGDCYFGQTTTITADSNSTLIITDARLDGAVLPFEVLSVSSVSKPAGNFAAIFNAPRRVEKSYRQETAIAYASFANQATYSFSGTSLVTANPVADGSMFPTCAELVIPAGNTQVYGSFTVTSGRWYVMTIDVKHVAGTLSDFNFQAVSAVPLCNNMRTLMTTGKWKTLATIGKAETSGACGLFLQNGAVGTQTLRLSAYQVAEFLTAQEAIDFYNAGIYQVGNTWPRTFHSYSIPTTGTWAVGDHCIHGVPVVGQPKGWFCTVAGTPGTWVSEGNL